MKPSFLVNLKLMKAILAALARASVAVEPPEKFPCSEFLSAAAGFTHRSFQTPEDIL